MEHEYGYAPHDPTTGAAAPAIPPPQSLKRISWGAIFAGALIALIVGVALNLLGIGIGAGTIDPVEEQRPFAGIGTGALIWGIVSTILALLAGGFVAGRMAGIPKLGDGILHGILAWAVATFVALFFLTTVVGRIVGGAIGIVGQGLDAAGRGIAAAGSAVTDEGPMAAIGGEVREMLRETRKPELQPEALEKQAEGAQADAAERAQAAARGPEQAVQEIEGLLGQVGQRGQAVAGAVDRDAIANVLVARTDMSREEAEKAADRWIAMVQQAPGQAGQALEQAGAQVASAISRAAIYGFIGLLLGAGAAAIGGALGAPGFVRRRRVPVERVPDGIRPGEPHPAGT
jgi:hypothetical protein